MQVLPVSGLLGWKKYHENREKLANRGFTEYDLSEQDLYVMLNACDIYIPEYVADRFNFCEENTHNREKDKFVLVKGNRTEKFAEALNELIFGRESKKMQAVLAAYGITEDNQFTLDWLITYPKEFIEIYYHEDCHTIKSIESFDNYF